MNYRSRFRVWKSRLPRVRAVRAVRQEQVELRQLVARREPALQLARELARQVADALRYVMTGVLPE